jgi:protein gp37
MTASKIEWTDRSDWNPVRGCTRVSPGCGGFRDAAFPMWCDSTDGNIDAEYCVGRVGKKAAGRLLDGREWNEFPQVRA